MNDLDLKVFNGKNLVGESNYLNLPGITGKREKVVLNNLSNQTLRAEVKNTLGVGTSQKYFGSVEATTVEYPNLRDLGNLSAQEQAIVFESLRSFMMLPQGSKFRAESAVTRANFAEAIVRSGLVPQFVNSNSMFRDVKDLSTRNFVESVQANPNGQIFYDVEIGDKFKPNNSVDKLTAAVALVRAANMEHLVSKSILSPMILDLNIIPNQFQGYVSVALQKGLLKTDGNKFNPNRSISRLELAQALVNIKNQSN
jgi:hypothetical protein